jgi:hypothetical protein
MNNTIQFHSGTPATEVLRSLLPEIQKIFGIEYAKYTKEKS